MDIQGCDVMGTWYSCVCTNPKCDYREHFWEGFGFKSFVSLHNTYSKIISGKFNHHKKCKKIFDLVHAEDKGFNPHLFFLHRNGLYMCESCKRAFTLRLGCLQYSKENLGSTSFEDSFEYRYYHLFGEPTCPYCNGNARHIEYSCYDIEGFICPKCGSPAIVQETGNWD